MKEKQSKLLGKIVCLGWILIGLWMMYTGFVNYSEFGFPSQIGIGFIAVVGSIYWIKRNREKI